MYKLIIAFLLLISGIYITGCGLSEDTVAKVGSIEISTEEYQNNLSRRYPNKTNYADVDSAGKMKILNSMVLKTLKVQAAYDSDLDEDPSLVSDLESQKARLVGNKYFEVKIVDQLISPEELKESFDRQKEEVKASHVLLSFKGSRGSKTNRSKEEAEKLANEISAKIKGGAELEKLAAEYSDDPSVARNKGDMGYFTWGRMVAEFQEAAFKMQPGDVSDPVLTDFGYHVIKLTDRRANPKHNPDNYDKAKLQLKRSLYFAVQDSGRKMWDALIVELKDQKSMQLNDENIAKLVQVAKEKADAGQLKATDYSDEEKNLTLATWKGTSLSVDDLFGFFYDKKFAQLRQKMAKADVLNKEIDNFVLQRMIIEEAEKMGLMEYPDVKDPLTDFEHQKLVGLIENQEINQKSVPDDEEIKKYYEENTKEFSRPAEMELWEIYVKDEKLANRIASWANAGRNFEKLASKYTEDKANKSKKGYLGYRGQNRRGMISKTAFEIGENKIAGPIKYRSGFAVIKTGKLKPETIKSFEEAESQVRSRVRNSKLSDRRKEWEQELRSRYGVTINEEIVETI